MAIKLNTHNFNIFTQIKRSGLFSLSEMRSVETFKSYLLTVKETEFAEWIEKNEILFLQGLLQGFIVNNEQNAQLKDLKADQTLADQIKTKSTKQERMNENSAYGATLSKKDL